MHRRKPGERELMEKHALHVSIIGGGIGGLAAASALQRQGIQVAVFERNPELREIGAGLTLWANGVQVLRQLGLADALARVSAPLTNFECWSWRGKRLGRLRLDTVERLVGAPSIGIHRADLLRLLAGTVERGSVHLHAHCVGFRSEPGHVISHFADGQQQQTDLLVGADGLYSVIREQLLGKQPRAIAATLVGVGSLSSRISTCLEEFPARRGGAVGALACCRLGTGECSGTPHTTARPADRTALGNGRRTSCASFRAGGSPSS